MTTRPGRSPEFTGRHMLLILVAFFGVIITVNVTMATFATSSWTGLVVKNTYVASQQFNDRVAAAQAQRAGGWHARSTIEGGEFRFAILDAGDRPIRLASAEVTFRRPVQEAADFRLALVPSSDGTFAAELALADGQWIVDVVADAGLDEPWREISRVFVRGGSAR